MATSSNPSSLAALDAHFAALADAHAQGRAGSLAAALAPLSDRASVCAMLRALLRDERRLAAVAERSYAHPNGFSKIVLASGPAHRLRLHIWWRREGPDGDEAPNVHNHRWDFASTLISGGYRYQQFTPLPARSSSAPRAEAAPAREFHAYSYASADDSSSYSLVPVGVQRLECVFDAHMAAGTGYELSADVLHRVIGDRRATTASLVFQGRDRRSTVDVYAERALAHGAAIALRRRSPGELAEELTRLLGQLAGGGEPPERRTSPRQRSLDAHAPECLAPEDDMPEDRASEDRASEDHASAPPARRNPPPPQELAL
ncbi:hypothetical protein LRS74_03420 [Streptomyces sp. LX-29]|uniref:hypothetical protein n=1 Tax=Streptomyces sp. LX-29 TaxID=2900152 RepID=UPI00240D134D|nr:hypothetical protein [Streptomyces sp. LX-29]WFB06199.1 hypothetical protein LRS74_03420 [Streptomyces sp. LX-29]